MSQVATPLRVVASEQPVIGSPSAVKSTLPVGVPPSEDTVAVNVTVSLFTDGLLPEVTTVAVSAGSTVTPVTPELVLKPVVPE